MRQCLTLLMTAAAATAFGSAALAQTPAAADQASDASALVQDADSLAYASRLNIMTLVEQGRVDEARAAFDRDWAAGVLPGPAPLDAANIAVSVGRDDEAQVAFRQADAQSPLSGANALNAGYSARRIGDDATAIHWFERGLDTWPTEAGFDDQRRFEIRREVETLQRTWGASASVSYGSAATVSSGLVGADTVSQAGGEVYRRIGGYNNGRPLEVFARVFTTLDSDLGGPTGGDTSQGWVGLRYRPLSETNLVLEASRMVALGDFARDDWVLRAAWSAEQGGDLRFDQSDWAAWRLYGDVAHMIDAEQTVGVAEARYGHAWRTSDRDIVTPFLTVRGYYDSALPDEVAVGAGPGVSWRHWFREQGYAAPASWIDFVLGYQFSVSGDARGEGVFVGFNINY